ncbi:MAG: outer membrane lipoprotein-sorting protein, partial [Proteobacteria bacterium]|nr:outer membrane lipoprotein-sorting protein [Pseudomonadota bacterium]
NSLLKTLDFSGYKEYNGYWRADNFRMENHQNGKKTILNWHDYDFGAGLNERDFNQNALKRLM